MTPTNIVRPTYDQFPKEIHKMLERRKAQETADLLMAR